MNKISTLLQNLFNFFYPRLCVSCQNTLFEKETHFCLHCLQNMPLTNYHTFEENPLNYIFMGRVPVQFVGSLLFYRKGNMVQSILQEIKYKNNKELGSYLGHLYGEQLAKTELLKDVDLIIPIPLHPKKEKLRGYNQSEMIAQGLSSGLNKEYSVEFLIRKDFTETQTKKSRINRWENVKDVFEVQNEEGIRNKHLLVCDDVLTTGATMEAALSKLMAVEGVRVSVVTLAVAG